MEKGGTDTDTGRMSDGARRPAQPEPSRPSDLEGHLEPSTVEQHVPTAQEIDVNADGLPEGGSKAWTVLFGTWCVLFCTFGLGNSIGVFQTYYVNNALRQYSSSTISWITSFMQWVLNFLPIIVGSPSFLASTRVALSVCVSDMGP